PMSHWDKAPQDWSTVYRALDPHRRQTGANKVVDRLREDILPQFSKIIGLFDEELSRAFAESAETPLVRQIAQPIIKNGERTLIEWLESAWHRKLTSWNAASPADRETFVQSLEQRFRDSQSDDERKLLQRIATVIKRKIRPALEDPAADGTSAAQ
ncbi:MAG: hypothetical protein QOF78_1176, partial [Phycisphaerales bacterium]|nr:hypothetical protein [Phycisphaerales bacterium]